MVSICLMNNFSGNAEKLVEVMLSAKRDPAYILVSLDVDEEVPEDVVDHIKNVIIERAKLIYLEEMVCVSIHVSHEIEPISP